VDPEIFRKIEINQENKVRIYKGLIILFLCFFIFAKEGSAFDTMIEYENKTRDGEEWFSNIDNCFSSGKAIFQLSVGDLNNVSIPHYLKANMTHESGDSRAGWSAILTLGRAYLYMRMLLSFSFLSIVAIIALGAEYMAMLDVCTNAFVIAPHEYTNIALGYKCCPKHAGDSNSGRCSGETKKKVHFVQGDNKEPPLTEVDVPFFYHCDPKWDPDTNDGAIDLNDSDRRKKLGNTYGYMKEASPYCTNGYGKLVGPNAVSITEDAGYGFPKDPKELIGHVLVYHVSLWKRIGVPFFDWKSQHTACTEQSGGTLFSITGKSRVQGTYALMAYYKFNNKIGKVQLCVAAPYTLFPVEIGCTYIPPPVNLADMPYLDIAEGTRCIYFHSGRVDLKSLGLYIKKSMPDDPHGNKESVSRFLMSDMHFTSTVVGCILDLLNKVFIDTGGTTGQPTFFQSIQENLKKIVLATLVLYVVLTGIKMMSAGESLKRADYVMFALKFALVAYFTLGNAWFEIDENGKKVGIYYGIIDGSQQIASYFMGAQNMSDPLGHCRYQYGNGQLLSQRQIPAVGVIKSTSGAKGFLEMTVWDLIDCRVVNYLNMGSCDYTFTGLIAIWSITALILVSGIGFILCIAMFIYSYMLLKIIFKFAHIFILSMFIITILVAVSPIMIVFVLFEFTKGIFDSWLKMLLGYIIYPGMHFAFIALMLATFDSIYFGGLKLDAGSPSIFEQCKGLGQGDDGDAPTSPICAIANKLNADGKVDKDSASNNMCGMSIGNIVSSLNETKHLWLLGSYTVMDGDVVEALFITMLKLALMAFLFFMLTNSVSGIFAYLAGVESLDSVAKGDLSGAFKKAFAFSATLPFKPLKMIAKKRAKKDSDKKQR
jgi:type IV secretion system protein VirB6